LSKPKTIETTLYRDDALITLLRTAASGVFMVLSTGFQRFVDLVRTPPSVSPHE